MDKATTNITAKVRRYCTSDTENENRGSTKNKSNKATLQNAAVIPAARPSLADSHTTTNKNNMTMFASANTCLSGVTNKVVMMQAATDNATLRAVSMR